MNSLGIFTGLDLRGQSAHFLQQHFGKAGGYYYQVARGIDDRPVDPARVRKSVGSENTFGEDLYDLPDLITGLQPLIDDVWTTCEAKGLTARTVTIKVKYANFAQVTRSRTQPAAVASRDQFAAIAVSLLSTLVPVRLGVRLLGVSFSELGSAAPAPPGQLSLF